MEKWLITQDVLQTIRKVAHEWSAGVVILKPFDGDFVMLAVTKVDMYAPSSNIHHSTISGKDVTMMIQQKLNIADPRGASPILTQINNIVEEQTWEVPDGETFYWLKVRELY